MRITRSKCGYYGINSIEVDEVYTSKTDALALEPIEKTPKIHGQKSQEEIVPVLYRSTLNADVNGALNILRKVVCESLTGIIDSGFVDHPRMTL